MLNEQLQKDTTMNKRLFQVFDAMNVNDEANKTAHLGCCYDMVEAKTAKGGGHVTMGVPAEAITKIFLGEYQPILLLLDKKEYHRLKDLPVQPETSEQLQRQIEQEAKSGQHTYPGTDYGHGFNKGYDSGYKFAGEKYASKWQEEKELRERYEKALREIQAKCVFPKTENEAGIAIYDILKICNGALTPKTTPDERGL